MVLESWYWLGPGLWALFLAGCGRQVVSGRMTLDEAILETSPQLRKQAFPSRGVWTLQPRPRWDSGHQEEEGNQGADTALKHPFLSTECNIIRENLF